MQTDIRSLEKKIKELEAEKITYPPCMPPVYVLKHDNLHTTNTQLLEIQTPVEQGVEHLRLIEKE